MALKQDFFDGLTGLHQKLNDSHDEGYKFVNGVYPGNATNVAWPNYASISQALKDAAAAGKTKFTVSLPLTYQPAFMVGNKGDNLLVKAHFAGMIDGLAENDVYSYEVSVALNTSDTMTVKVDLNFNFQTS